MCKGLIAGEQRPGWLADKAQGTLRSKRNQLRVVLRGHVTEHHRWMLRRALCQSAWAVLRDETQYLERGGEYFDQLHPERARNRLLKRLERLAWDVSLIPRTPSASDS